MARGLVVFEVRRETGSIDHQSRRSHALGPHRQDKHWATTERSETEIPPNRCLTSRPAAGPTDSGHQLSGTNILRIDKPYSLGVAAFRLCTGWFGAQVKIGSGREWMMTRGEWIIQLTKIAMGVAIAAYFVWWSLEVLQRLPPR
jgi:hypothetical protein